ITIGSLEAAPERIIQFGEGNFLRAFVDWQFNELSRRGLFSGSIVLVQPLKEGMINEINEQDGLYTLLQRGIQHGAQVERTDIITSVKRGINPYENWSEYLACARNPEMRFMISNTTEAGISYVETKQPTTECPQSFPAKVTAFLLERFTAFAGDPDKGMIIIPCELIKQNGDHLKSCILKHAADWKCDRAFTEWIERSNHFCNTLVDRIVPGYPKDEIEAVKSRLGYEDKIVVATEPFHLWVIQGDAVVRRELPFTEAGLNVVWTDDIKPYRTLKVRILNGSHTLFTIPALLAGKHTVRESVEDPLVGKFFEQGLFGEILPALAFPEKEKREFAEAILERFKNPFIKHYLSSITLNSVSKFTVRVLPSLLESYDQTGRIPKAMTLSLAALIRFYNGTRDAHGAFSGCANGHAYAIKDDDEVIRFFESQSALYANDPDTLCKNVLAQQQFWGRDLNAVEGLTSAVTASYRSILEWGMAGAMMKAIQQ
ncbi:MAG TPA: tagaturonate reductase, partial [Bacteroidota bacterium]|nr:tagaturonate reductase [Bacteroidota bacterium]